MKSICTIGLSLVISMAAIAQDKENNKPKEKEEKESKAAHKRPEEMKHHEQVIWAGTGIDLNSKSKDVKNVPDAVMASFRQYFPDQEIDNVMKYHGLYAITFSNEVYTTTLIYKTNGTFVEARTVATEADLPVVVKDKVKRKSGYSTSDVVIIENANKEKFYRVHMKKGVDSEFLFYNSHGDQVLYDY